jgi:hypothetical protein
MSALRFDVGAVRLTRISYAEVGVPPEVVGLTPEQVANVEWGEPLWAGDGEVKAAAAVWIIESGDARIAVDPAQAADDILRSEADAEAHQTAFATLLAAAGFPRESITHAIATHAEGVGMWAWRTDDGAWVPFFPNAEILVDQRELDAIDDGTHPSADDARFARLREQGAVLAVTHAVTDEVTVEVVGAHSPGHLLVWINSGADAAVMVGHLALSPLHFATGECPQQHPDPPAAEGVLERLRGIDALLIGPLWPTPGAGYWVGAAFTPATPAAV